MHRVVARLLLLALAAAACGGSSGQSTPPPIVVSGSTLDYFSSTALSGATIATVGLTPAIVTTSGVGGAYSLSGVSSGSTFLARLTATNYRATNDEPIAVTTTSRTIDLHAVSIADANRQYAGLGMTPTAGRAVVIVDLVGTNGALVGIPAASILLVDTAGTPAPGISGPFFFGAAGDLVDNATLANSTDFGGRARAGFLDVPTGAWEVRVSHGTTDIMPFTASSDGAHLLRTRAR